MVALLSFPPRLNTNGEFATVEQNSDEHLGEEIAILMCTKIGERALLPGFGISDPAFSQVDEAELSLKIAAFEIPVRIVSISSTHISDSTQQVLVEFDTDIRRGR